MVFWNLKPRDLAGGYNVSKERIPAIFIVKHPERTASITRVKHFTLKMEAIRSSKTTRC
jgi:hypothetical protein